MAVFAAAVKIPIKVELTGKRREIQRRPGHSAGKRVKIQCPELRYRRSDIVASVGGPGHEIVRVWDVEAEYRSLGKNEIADDCLALTRHATDVDADLW